MQTTLYLVRPAAPAGDRRAALTRDFLAVRPLDACYCSPTGQALETAQVIAEPHGLAPCPHDGLAASDSFDEVQARVAAVLEDLLGRHPGGALLVVAHRPVHVGYLAGLLHLTADQAARVRLDRCGVSVIIRAGGRTRVATLNAAFHLQGAA